MADRPQPNPYAPPAAADEAPPFAPERASRGLRLGGAVLLLLVSLWSTAGGGCSIVAGHGLSQYSDELVRALPGEGQAGGARQALRQLQASAPGLLFAGTALLASGVLGLVAAILFLLDRGRVLGLLAIGLGVFGELAFFALVSFNAAGLLKLACLGCCGFCALRVGVAGRAGPPGAAAGPSV